MKVVCRTNLNLHREEWPIDLPTIAVGHLIQSKTQWVGGFQLSLEVVGVTWIYSKYKNEWYAELELHDPLREKRSIRDFYTWYAPLVGCIVSSFI